MTRPIFATLMMFMMGFGLSFNTQAQVFECKDAQGRKIMASRCPLGTTIVKEVEIAPVPSGLGQKAADKKPAPSQWASDVEFKERQKQKEDQAAEERAKQRRDQERCYQDQKRLNTLKNGLPLSIGENAQGEPILMEDEQRAEEIKKIQEKLKACKPD